MQMKQLVYTWVLIEWVITMVVGKHTWIVVVIFISVVILMEFLSWNNSTDQLVITGSIFAENGIFSGTVSGSSIEGGQINIIGGTFSVDGSGSMVATNAVISGEITSNDATLGGWIVDSDAITSEDGNVVIYRN